MQDQYTDVQYRLFNLSSADKLIMKIAGYLSMPFVYPLVLLAKMSPKIAFLAISEFLSFLPCVVGIIVRYEFYRRTLRSCGEDVFIHFGTVFYYPDVSIGNNVLIGMYNTVHHCDFGNDVLTAEGCRFLNGSKYHDFSRTDIPMNQQGGKMKRISIGDDVWIGANAVVMEDVANGAVVGAGSVVTKKVQPFRVAVGNPARTIRKRL
jgi:acetyltransferase-like isoleucine patch superfamily enzyme